MSIDTDILKFLDILEKEHSTVEVVKVSTDHTFAYLSDSFVSQYLFYLDFSNYPKTVNISTLKGLKNGGYACILYNQCSLEKFIWSVESSRALIYETFGAEV